MMDRISVFISSMEGPVIRFPKCSIHLIRYEKPDALGNAKLLRLFGVAAPSAANVEKVDVTKLAEASMNERNPHRVFVTAQDLQMIFLCYSVDFENNVVMSSDVGQVFVAQQ
jgi:hypothetical protein